MERTKNWKEKGIEKKRKHTINPRVGALHLLNLLRSVVLADVEPANKIHLSTANSEQPEHPLPTCV